MQNDTLLTPGPTPLPPQVREAMGRQIIHHRTSAYRAISSASSRACSR